MKLGVALYAATLFSAWFLGMKVQVVWQVMRDVPWWSVVWSACGVLGGTMFLWRRIARDL